MKIFSNKISHQGDNNLENCQNPWAGLASYDDPETAVQKLKFCGRDDDSYDVARLIQNNIFITLYGKSGIGKTSLLNAGVFPELREERFTPMSLRLGMRDEKEPKSFQTIIVENIEHNVNRIETINIVDKQLDERATDYLWNYFVRHRFYDKSGEPTTPVVVLDQFEEVFRSGHEETDTLLQQLDYINDKDHSLDNCTVNGQSYRYESNFRFVISIREDDLYRLEDCIDNCYLPALKRCRYRLRSLSEQGASDAILIPGEGLFLPVEQDGIVKAIVDKSRNEDGSISTNILSLLCNRIFSDFQKSQATHISQLLVDNFIKGNPFERFYNEATRGFSNREKSYIENHFVDSTGRRNSIPESDFLFNVPKGTSLLEGGNRILQRISTSADGGNYRVELIHDSFCEPLAGLKEQRKRRRRIKWLASSAAIALLCLGVLGYIIYQMNKIQSQEDTIAEKDEDISRRNQELETKNKQLLLQRDSLLAIKNVLSQKNKELEESNLQLQKEKESLRVAKIEINKKNTELESKILELDDMNEQLAYNNYRLNSINYDLDEQIETNREILARINGSSLPSYEWDDIVYSSPYPSDSALTAWKERYGELCKQKTDAQIHSYDIDEIMLQEDPCLVYLILNSRSITEDNEDNTPQEWFYLWNLMNSNQKDKLYRILIAENYCTFASSSKNEVRLGNQEAYRFAKKGLYQQALARIDKAISDAKFYYACVLDSRGEILLMQSNENEGEALRLWNQLTDIVPDFLDHFDDRSTNLYKQLKEKSLVK